jgi:hypothetical protein
MRTRVPRTVWTLTSFLLPGAAFFFSGCSSTVPLASPAEDAEAKLFRVEPHRSNIYVIRTQPYAQDLHDVAIDGGARVSLVARTYTVFSVDPGVHSIVVYSTMNRASMTIETREGANYFIGMGMGMTSGFGPTKVTVKSMSESKGMEEIKTARLVSREGY